jgi:HEAT repeat protein
MPGTIDISDEQLLAALNDISHTSTAISTDAHEIVLSAGERSIPLLLDLLVHGKAFQRRSALSNLWKQIRHYRRFSAQLLAAMLQVCESDMDRNCRMIALECMAIMLNHFPDKVPEEAFTQFILHEDWVIRERAATLAMLFSMQFCIPWLVLLLDDEYESVREVAYRALRRFKKPEARYAMFEWEKRG